MEITWTTRAHGWEGILLRNAQAKNDYTQPRHIRNAADRAIKKIERQLADKRLMGMRERLMKATSAHDESEIIKITKSMRAYNKEDQETGLYE